MTLKDTNAVERNLDGAFDRVRRELDRIELLTAAMSAFGRPIPDYEPAFRHMHPMLTLSAHEIQAAL